MGWCGVQLEPLGLALQAHMLSQALVKHLGHAGVL
jgi:hypothetical protein